MRSTKNLKAISLSLGSILLVCGNPPASSGQSGRAPVQQERPRTVEEKPPAQAIQRVPQPAPVTLQEKKKGDTQEKNKGESVEPDEVLTVSTDLTNILLTAVDKDKRFITTLKQTDLQVLENGVVQEISMFERQTDLPLSIGILVDVSGSEAETLPDEKAAAREFVQSVIRPTKDEVAVISFTGEATVEQALTNRVLALEKAINNIEIVLPPEDTSIISASGMPIPIRADPRAGSTAIWDAIYSTSNEMLANTPEHTRRAIILLTDGQDTSSRVHREEAVDRALKDNVTIYSVGIGDRRNFGVEEKTLRRLSERTGGRAYFPRSEEELRGAFAQIQDELRSQYLVAYSSNNKVRDGSYRKIQIDVVNPELKKEKLRLLHREGYFARATTGTKAGAGSGKKTP
jgi:VWFA-related protein